MRETITPSVMNLMAVGFRIVNQGKNDFVLRFTGEYWRMDVYENDGWYVNLTGVMPTPKALVEGKQAFEKPEDGVIKALGYLLQHCVGSSKTRNQIQTMLIALNRQSENQSDSISERYQQRIKQALTRYTLNLGK